MAEQDKMRGQIKDKELASYMTGPQVNQPTIHMSIYVSVTMGLGSVETVRSVGTLGSGSEKQGKA